jgi:TolB-like protein/DNA-binding SARP family transcriptional activator/Tfp pilus assembly protein PilF
MYTLQLLGALDLRDPTGQAVRSVIAQPKRIAVLAYLALHEGFCRRDTLLPIFWPEQDEDRARASLRKLIYNLRKSLGDQVVVGRGDDEVGFGDGVVRCDAREMRRALQLRDPKTAVELYRGDLLPGFNLPDVPDFECWLDAERERLRLDTARAADALADSCRADGKLPEALDWSRRRLALTPGDESALRRVLLILEAMGDRGAAVEAFEHFSLQLRLTYGLEPSAETQDLIDHVRAGRPAVETATPSEPRSGTRQAGPALERVDSLPVPSIAELTEPRAARPGRPTRHVHWQRGVVLASFVLPILLLLRTPILTLVENAFGARSSGAYVPAHEFSIAVLPIADVSPGRDAEYLSVGMTDELINALGRLEGLRVAARTSTFAIARDSVDIRDVARKLGVRYVLEGSLRRDGSRVRLALQLIDATDGQQRWAQSYDREISDVLAMQEEISESVTAALRGPLELSSPTLRATGDAEAYDQYLRGRFLLNQGGREPVQAAIRHFSAALDRDSSYALAYAGIADAHLSLADWVTPRSVLPAAKAAAERAIQLDDRLFETHLALAKVLHRFDWDWERSEREFKRALELAPDEPSVHYQYADFLRSSRRFDESLAATRRGLALEAAVATAPLQFALYERERLSAALFRSHRYREAITMAESALELDPNSGARMNIVYASQMLGDFARASSELERLGTRRGDSRGAVAMARNFVHAGKSAEARRLLEETLQEAQRQYVPRDQIAHIYLAVGDTSRALQSLDAAVSDQNWFMVFWNSDPFAESLRDDPRFRRILSRINAPA